MYTTHIQDNIRMCICYYTSVLGKAMQVFQIHFWNLISVLVIDLCSHTDARTKSRHLKKKTKHFDHHHYSFWEIMSEPSMSGSDPQACGGPESSTTQGAIILQDHAVSQRFRDKLNHCPVTQPSGWSGAVSDQPIIFTWNKKKKSICGLRDLLGSVDMSGRLGKVGF